MAAAFFVSSARLTTILSSSWTIRRVSNVTQVGQTNLLTAVDHAGFQRTKQSVLWPLPDNDATRILQLLLLAILPMKEA